VIKAMCKIKGNCIKARPDGSVIVHGKTGGIIEIVAQSHDRVRGDMSYSGRRRSESHDEYDESYFG